MKQALFIVISALVAASSAIAGPNPQALAAVARPLQEGVPEAAITPLTELMAQASSDDERAAVAEKLGEALVAAKRPSDALKILELPAAHGSAAAKFQSAQALAQLGRYSESAAQFGELVQIPNAFHPAAILGRAEMSRAEGRRDEALQLYGNLVSDTQFGVQARLRSAELLIDKGDLAAAHRLLEEVEPKLTSEKRERRLLRGRLELASHRPDRAVAVLQPLLRRIAGTPHELVIVALLAIADAHVALGTPEAGDDFLEDYIEHHPTDTELPRVFAKLDRLYTMERRPGRGELERWAHDAAQPRRALSQWYVARLELRGGRRDRALRDFEELARTEPQSSESIPGLLELAELKIAQRDYQRALQILELGASLQPRGEMAARVNFALGRVQQLVGDARAAAGAFERVSSSAARIQQAARLNASLAWMQAGDDARAQHAAAELPDAARADLRLEEGLAFASRGEARAAETLRAFIRDFGQHPRVSEAHVALAELAFHAAPPRLNEARENLDRAKHAQPTSAARERGDYLEVWIEDSTAGAEEKVIAAATAFLRDHSDSKLIPDVRMKLGETYFRRQDFANAQTQFELLAQQNAGSAFADKALFFAAQCAMTSFEPHAIDRALALLGQLVRSPSDLRWAARNQQANIERKLGKLDEALVLYDEVLKNDARPADKREALCGKGDLFFELGARDPANYARASDCYAQLAKDNTASAHWRDQALFKQAVCIEKQGDQDAALATLYRVLDAESRDRSAEFFWFYKAGFDAARILEEATKWESAAVIYERLASAGGPRSDEAKNQLDRLRLEHFLLKD